MRNHKKNLAAGIALLVLLLCLFMPVQTAEAYSTGDTYPARYRNRAKDAVVDQWGYYNRECTSFVAYCLYTRNGFTLTNWYKGEHFGNARTWLYAARQLGITVNSTPAVGAVGVSTAGRAGHVVWVKSVNGNKITTDEYNWNNDGRYHTRTTDKSSFTYIHFKDITYKLNVNLTVNGTAKNGGVSGVTYDVTVGGTKKGNNVKEYNAANPAGQSYSVNDIKLSGCYELAGAKTYSGTLNDDVTVTIPVTLKHSYDKGVVTKEATCTKTGVKTYTCTVCGAKKTKTIAALGHDFRKVDTDDGDEENSDAEGTESGDAVVTDDGDSASTEDGDSAVVEAGDSASTQAGDSAVTEAGDSAVTDAGDSDANPADDTDSTAQEKICSRCGMTYSAFTSAAASAQMKEKPASVKLSYSKTTYNGKAKKPSVTVKNSKGVVLKKGTDYTVAYSHNKSVGTATVVITAKGQYCGVFRKNFKIYPGKVSVKQVTSGYKRLTVTMTSKASAAGGQYYQIAYKQSGTSKWKYTVTSAKSKTIKSLKRGKKYSVKVRAYKKIDGKKYYGSWSSTKTSGRVR